jgi:hypothetical protein
MNANPGLPYAEPYRALWEHVWRMEQELNLFERRIGDTYYWPLIRDTLPSHLSQVLGIHAPPPNKLKFKRMKRAAMAAMDIARGSAISQAKVPASDTILVPFNRKQWRDGAVIDPLCHRLLEETGFGRFLVLDNRSDLGLYTAGPNRCVYNWDTIRLIGQLQGQRLAAKFVEEAEAETARITNWIAQNVTTAFSTSPHKLALKCAQFETGRALSRDIFARSGARRLFIVARNIAPEMVAAANDLGLQTAEIQHGLMNKFAPYYHYPRRPAVPYAPDFFLSFAPYWTEGIDLPRASKVVTIGADDIRARLGSIVRKPRTAVILSQWVVDDILFEIATELACKRPGWNFIFRMHPLSNVSRYQNKLAQVPPNLSLSVPSDDVLAVLAGAEVQIGAYSTSLCEGMALGLRTIVAALPGSECMKNVIAHGDAVLAHDADEIANLLEIAPPAIDGSRYYAPAVPSIAAAMAACA